VASTCRILARSSPVAEVLETEVDAGFALADLLTADGKYWVEVDGRPVEDPHAYVVAPGDRLVAIVGLPGDPGSVGAAIYSAFIAIGASSGVAVTAGSIAAALAAGAGFIAAYGGYIAAAAALVTVATMDTPSAPQSGAPERQNSLTGVSNRFAPFAACPVLYGKRRLFPPFAAAPYTELVGQDQYLNMLFLVSLGDCDLSALKIGDADATSFDAIEATRHYPTAPAWPVVTDTDVSIQLDDEDWTGTPNRQHTATTTAGSTEAAIDFNFPIGLLYTNSKGERRRAKVHFRVEYRLQGTTPWLNARGTAWVTTTRGTNTVLGASGPAVPAGVGAIAASTRRDRRAVGTVSAKAADTPVAGKTRITVTTGVDAWTDKAYKLSKSSTGTANEWPAEAETTGAAVTQWLVSNADAANYSVGNFVWLIDDGTATDFVVAEKTSDGFRAGLKFPLGAAGIYEIRVTRTYLEQNDPFTNYGVLIDNPTTRLIESQKYQQVMIWTLLHSYTTEQAVTLPASVDATFLKVRIKATDQLNGQLEDVNVLAERRLRYWTGSAWAGPAKTRSPAWAFLDMLVNPVINQRGFGEAGAAQHVDLAAVKAWHDGLITTEVFKYDEVIDYPVSVYAGLRRAAGVAWAGIGIPDGKFSVTVDANTSPVQMFTPRNSSGFSAVKNFVDLPHALKVQFDSEDADNRQDMVVVYADGYNASTATKFESVRMPGVTDADQAWKLGRRMIALAKLRPETFTFEAELEHLLCKRGDAVLMQHDVSLWGVGSGRIVAKAVDTPSAGTTTVTLDEAVITEVGPTYAVRVRRTDATPPVLDEFAATPAVAGNANAQWRVTNAQAANWRLGDLVAVGKTGQVTQKLKILDIKPKANLKATIVAAEDAAGVYTAHTGTIPAYSPNVTLPADPRNLVPAQPTITDVRADTGVATINPDGSRILGATIAYEFGSNYDRFARLSSVLRYRAEPESGRDATWTYVTKPVADGAFAVRGLEAGIDYEFQVAVSSAWEKWSPFSDVFSVTVGAPTPPQEGFEGLTVTGRQGGFDIIVDFTTREDRGVDRFELVYHTANNRDDVAAKTYPFRPTSDLSAANTIGASLDVLTPIATHYFWVRWVDVFGNESPWFPSSATAGVSATNSRLARDSQGPAVSDDPWFQDSIIGASDDASRPWMHLFGDSGAVVATVTDGQAGTKALRSDTAAEKWVVQGTAVPVDRSKTYAVRALVRRTGSCDYRGRLVVMFYDSAGALIDGGLSGATGWPSLGTGFYPWFAQPWPDAFTRVALSFGALGAASIPAGARAMRVGVLFHEAGTGSTVGTMDVQDLRVDEVMPSVLIEDQAITAPKLVADLVLASLVRSGSSGFRVELEGGAELPIWAGDGAKGNAASPGSGALLYLDRINGKLVVRGLLEASRIKPDASNVLPIEVNATNFAPIVSRVIGGNYTDTGIGTTFVSVTTGVLVKHPTSGTGLDGKRLQAAQQPILLAWRVMAWNGTGAARTMDVAIQYNYDGGTWTDIDGYGSGIVSQRVVPSGRPAYLEDYEWVKPKAASWSSTLNFRIRLKVDSNAAGFGMCGVGLECSIFNLGAVDDVAVVLDDG
jgi:hypothetical protein